MNSIPKPDSKRKTKTIRNIKSQSSSNAERQPTAHLKTQHRLFALAVFSGLSQRAAYLQAYPSASPRTAEVQSSRLITRPDIRATLDHLHSQVETQAILTLQEKRAYLARIVRTSATDVRPGTDLVQAITTAKDGSQTLRLPDKLRAIYLDARLAGELPPLNHRLHSSSPANQAPQRPAHETILNQALKSICFGTNPNTGNNTIASPASSSPPQLEPIPEPKRTPAPPPTPPLIPNPAYQLWPPRPPIQTAPPPTPATPTPPATTPQSTSTPAPKSPPQTPPNPAQPSPLSQPQQQLQAKPEGTASSTPPPYIPTIRRRHIRLGRRPWGQHIPQQNSGEISLQNPNPNPAPAPQGPTPQR